MREVEKNFRMLLIEVAKQAERAKKALNNDNPPTPQAMEAQDDYVDNLKSVIENLCYTKIAAGKGMKANWAVKMRAMNIAAQALETVADHAVNMVRQMEHLRDREFLKRFDCESGFEAIFSTLSEIPQALFDEDSQAAFEVCRVEPFLDAFYKKRFNKILSELPSGKNTGDLVTSLFILRYMERIGDSLLDVGEAAIFAITGDKFKIRQFTALQETMALSGNPANISEIDFHSIWGTRSGCRIGLVHQSGGAGSGSGSDVIFKDGSKDKLIEESENIDRWEKISPGLAPKVKALRVDGNNASMLVELLSGKTFQDVILEGSEDEVHHVLDTIMNTAASLWEKTMRREECSAGFIGQLRKRMADVYRLHPGYNLPARNFSGLKLDSIRTMIQKAKEMDASVKAPFSVFIHGDFNINNIFYNPDEDKVHYIDLHRSAHTDYLQDVSVFLISNIRLNPVPEAKKPVCTQVAGTFYRFAKKFGQEHGDETFDFRLALGLVRSMITSTRFEFDYRFAASLFGRGVYLLEKLCAHKGGPKEFILPEDALTR